MVVSKREVHSEDEVKNSNSSGTQNKIRKDWRGAGLDTFITLVDRCLVHGEVIPKKIRAVRKIVDRGPYSSTPEPDSRPPKGFPKSLVSPTWIEHSSQLTVTNLALVEGNAVDIEGSIAHLSKLLEAGGSGSSRVGASSGSVMNSSGVASTEVGGTASTSIWMFVKIVRMHFVIWLSLCAEHFSYATLMVFDGHTNL